MSVTRILLSLHRKLWARSLRANPATILMACLFTLYGLGGLLAMSFFIAMAARGEADPMLLGGIIGLGTTAYLIAAAMVPSGETQLDASQFATLPIRPRALLPGLALANILQTRGLLAALCTLVTGIIITVADPALAVIAWPMLLVAFAVTIGLGLVLTGAFGASNRTSKEKLTTIVSAGVMVLLLVYTMVINNAQAIDFGQISTVLGWTPLGAAGAAIGAAKAGSWALMGLYCLIALATVGVVVWLWASQVSARFTEPLEQAGGPAQVSEKASHQSASQAIMVPGLRWSPAGVIASRALRYLRRDSRIMASVIVFPLVGVILLVQGVMMSPFNMYLGAVMMCLALQMCSNDFGYDGPSGWSVMISGVRGATQVRARHLAWAVPIFALVVAYLVALIVVAEDHHAATLFAIAALGLAFSAAAFSLVATVVNPFPTSRPGTSPWGDRSGFSSAAFITTLIVLLVSWIPVAPGAALLFYSYRAAGSASWAMWTGGVLVVAVPAVLWFVVSALAGRRVERRWPEIFQRVRSWVN